MSRTPVTGDSLVVIHDKVVKVEDDKKTKIENLMNLVSGDGKFLVFSKSDVAFDKISKLLEDGSVPFNKLLGNSAVIQSRVDRYNEGHLKVLLLNPAHYGCGINLEKTTDIVFFHKFDVDMERQIIGRAQRIGREHRLRVHYLFYETNTRLKNKICTSNKMGVPGLYRTLVKNYAKIQDVSNEHIEYLFLRF